MMNHRILFLDDESKVPLQEWDKVLVDPMADLGFRIILEDNPDALMRHLEDGLDGILLDLKFGKRLRLGFDLLKQAKHVRPNLPILVLTVDSGINVELDCAAHGADGYVCKADLDVELLAETLRLLINAVAGSHLLLGYSDQARRLRTLIRAARACDSTVLIIGDTGTGKELVAKGTHLLGPRWTGQTQFSNFWSVNCAGIPDALWESEMFGHRKGSATGLTQSHAGAFLRASGYTVEREPRGDSSPIQLRLSGVPGTLFLDEAGEISMAMQAKMLRAIQERRVRLVGDPREYPLDARLDLRIVAATNKNLREQIRNGEFRKDLYYRLNVLPIEVPSLAQRLEDIPVLVAAFIKARRALDGSLPVTRIEDGVIELLQNHSWPGNIRELDNVVERALVATRLEKTTFLNPRHIFLDPEVSVDSEDLHIVVAHAIVRGELDPKSINPRPKKNDSSPSFGTRVYRAVAEILRAKNALSQEKLAEVWNLDRGSIGPLNTRCGVKIGGG